MRYLKTLKYGFHVMVHPFDGFWDLKREHRGSIAAALTFVVLTVITSVIQKQNTAFLFNMNNLKYLNVMVDIVTVAMLYVLWSVSSWCLTSLMDGEGTLKDIMTATGYALLPFIIINLPLVIVSYMITTEEGAFYYTLQMVSYIWTGALVFFGTMVTHQYSFKKTVLTVILTLVGMAIILFIGLLFFSVLQQMLSFIVVIYKEAAFR